MHVNVECIVEKSPAVQHLVRLVAPEQWRNSGSCCSSSGALDMLPFATLGSLWTGRPGMLLQPVHGNRMIARRDPALTAGINGVVVRLRVRHVRDGHVQTACALRHPVAKGAIADERRP